LLTPLEAEKEEKEKEGRNQKKPVSSILPNQRKKKVCPR